MTIHHAQAPRGGQTPDAATPSIHAASGAPHRLAVEVERCAECPREYPANLLWRVVGVGRVCPECLERLREEAAS